MTQGKKCLQIQKHTQFFGRAGCASGRRFKPVQQAIINVPEVGLSILGISHRSAWFENVVRETENNIRTLLGLPADYHVLFLQGGATQQFSMVPMTMLRGKKHPAEYFDTGYWSRKVITEAMREGPVRVIWSGEKAGYRRLPTEEELDFHRMRPTSTMFRMRRWKVCSLIVFRGAMTYRACATCRRIFIQTLRCREILVDLRPRPEEYWPRRGHYCAYPRRSGAERTAQPASISGLSSSG